MDKTVLVVGLSAASVAFISKLRSFDKNVRIICFSAEPDRPYNRCLLADFLTHEATLEGITLKSVDFSAISNLEVHLNTCVTKIDTQEQRVWAGEQTYQYDYLFLGIGTRPWVPVNLQVDDTVAGVFTFHTLRDMQRIEAYLQTTQVKSVVVIGGGLNGLEAASALMQKNIDVTLVEAQQRLLPCQVDHEVASWVEQMAVASGLTVITGQKVAALHAQDARVRAVQLENNTEIAADMVIVAAGSKLNSELLIGTGIELRDGSILVSEHMQTSIPNVFAAGDICVVPDLVTKKLVRSVTWSDAMLQGLCAATTLGATPRPYQGALGLRDSYFFGKYFYGCGDTTSTEYTKIVRKMTPDTLDVVYVSHGRLRGFVLMGDVSAAPELKKLYVTQEVCF